MNTDKDGKSEDIGIDGVDPSVGFLYKTMLQRDPKKRRVKPVQKHLIQVDFGGAEDSDDDSDFEVSKIEDKGSGESDVDDELPEDGEEGTSNVAEEEGSEGDGSESASESASSSQSDSGEDSEPCTMSKALEAINTDDDSDDEDYVPKKEKNSKEAEKPRIKSPDIKSERTIENSAPESVPGHLKVIICCVCLGDIRYRDSDHILIEEDDEIVECDNCGASVHEGCYGISEAQSAASTESSASTEPWFCDACKAGVMPNCELCPNKGGIYKETDAGKWVHLVCALYIPGVAFGDVDKLSPVTLFEMPYSKWGAKECSLCEEPAFCRTGVCISCDAGMCRTFFHVTCAQREGLLSEASPEEDIADPFFAYCKLHADKTSMRAKRRNWLAIQSRVKKHADLEIEDDKERLRVIRKLNRHRQKYVIAKSKRSPSWVPTTKMVRHLTSCPSAVRRMLRKAEVMGIITQVQAAPHEKPEKRKKWHISPALSVEFITHFLNRNTKITSTRDKLTDLTQQNDSLREQEKVLRHQYDQSMSEMDELKVCGTRMKDEAERFWAILSKFGGKTSLKRPEFLSIKKPLKSPTRRGTPLSPPAVIHQCGLCQKSHDQHLLAKCDKCRLHYHLGCLDPPLSRMPKKTKLMGWQCSECAGSSSDESEETGMDVNAPRRLREKIKEPTKFMPTNAYKFDFSKMHERTQKHPVKMKKKGGGKKRKLPPTEEKGSSEKSEPPVLKREKVERQTQIAAKKKQKEKQPELKAECCVCEGSGTNSNMVRCDECQLCYHFHCLVPPLRKTPKQRGYTWHCEACDPTDNSEDVEFEEEEAEESKSPPPPLLKKEISSGEETSAKGRNKTELKS